MTRQHVVPWLAQAPTEWTIKPLYSLGSEVKTLNRGLVEDNLLSLSYGEIKRKDIEANFGLLPESFETYQIVEPGDMVFRFTDLQNDQKSLRSGLVRERGIITNAYLGFRPKSIDSRYFNYLMRAYDILGIFYSMGSGLRQSLNYSDVRRLPIPVPSDYEQRRIADFLDRETAKIDALIAIQEQLITTLDERRTAFTSLLISEISARGIQRRVSAVAQLINGFPFDSESFEIFGEVPLVRIRDILSEKFETFVPRNSVPQKAWIRDGDLVIGMDGDFNLTLWDRGEAALNQRVCVLRTAEPVVGSWIAHCLPAELKKINDLTYATTVKHLSSNQIARIMIPMPDLPEMTKAVQELDREHARVSGLLGRIRETLTVLRERRQALISAAVTGKLEVSDGYS